MRLPSVVEVAGDAFGKLGTAVIEHVFERLQAGSKHFAHRVATGADDLAEQLRALAEGLADLVAALHDGIGDTRAGLLELRHHVAAAQVEVEDE